MARKDCVICGQDHPRCNGHKKIDENTPEVRPCMVHPRDMEDVCRLHGGNLPTIKAAGNRARTAKKLDAEVTAVLGYSLDGQVPDVMAAMEGLAAAELARVQALAAHVNGLERLRYASIGPGTEQIRGEVQLLERATDRAMKFLEVVAKHRPDGEAAAAVNLLTSLSDQIKAMKE